MSDAIILNLPFPPSVNSYYSRTRNGIFIKKKGKEFRNEVIELCNEQGAYGLRIDYPLAVGVILYPPDLRIRDIDNYNKGLFDAITHARVWVDDKQIKEQHIVWGKKTDGGGCSVILTEWSGFLMSMDGKNTAERVVLSQWLE